MVVYIPLWSTGVKMASNGTSKLLERGAQINTSVVFMWFCGESKPPSTKTALLFFIAFGQWGSDAVKKRPLAL